MLNLLLNVLWFLFGGILLGGGWLLCGALWCATLIGIPWGLQCFKFSALMFAPFGKQVIYGGGMGSLFLNLLWLILSGLPLALYSCVIGIILCLTVIGLPLGLQCFKFSRLALMPFGSRVI